MPPPTVKPRRSPGAVVHSGAAGQFRLEIPPGGRGAYRLAQVDDYTGLRRKQFCWKPPLDLTLEASIDSPEVPGTWGFGFWNAPVQFSILPFHVDALPALPQTAWFFFTPEPGYLTFRDDLPGRGFLAQTFCSAGLPSWPLIPAAAILPFLALRPFARRLRRLISSHLIRETGASLSEIDPCRPHAYRLRWDSNQVEFYIDDSLVLESSLAPLGPLGLVIWIDNQYAAFRPDGSLGYGVLAAQTGHRLEIAELRINDRLLRLESGS